MARVWIADDDDSVRFVLQRALQQAEFEVMDFPSADQLLASLDAGNEAPDVVITDLRMPGTDGFQLVDILTERCPELPVLVMTAFSDLENAVAAYRKGAFEYLPKPFDLDEVIAVTQRACARDAGADGKEVEPKAPPPVTGMIGESAAMQQVFRAIGRLSNSELNVLITGETGAGKELVAQALHKHSPRHERPLIALNTAAIPAELLESELFGHERGAFTGANERRVGRFEQAHQGALFLDEIGDMPATLQTRLLRVLAEGEFYRVGGRQLIRVDVRVIAATHVDLEQRVASGAFREDLFHRLNVIGLEIPPLRHRREDILPLTDYFLQSAAEEAATQVKQLHDDAAAALSHFSWPGNVRQLKNLCRRLTVMTPGAVIHASDLPHAIRGSEANADQDLRHALHSWAHSKVQANAGNLAHQAVQQVERELLTLALRHTGGHRQNAAKLLGWGRNTLTRKLKDLDLSQRDLTFGDGAVSEPFD